MKNDIHKTFGEIFDGDITAFRKQLLEIQHIQADRKKAEDWVSKLRFLDISKVPNLLDEEAQQYVSYEPPDDPWVDPEIPSHEIPVTEREDDDSEVEYIAVSWKWEERHHNHLDDAIKPPVFDYQIKRPGAPAHKSSFPGRYMDRVIRFAQSKSISSSKLWIDKECIYQRREDEHIFPEDKEHGVQIMDVVYGDSTLSVGLLTVELAHEHEVDLLSELLQGEIFAKRNYQSLPKLLPGVDERAVQMIILRILSDPRWSRGWIFQEDHLASHRMILLIPCRRGIRKDQGYDFGDTMGELQVRLKDFRQSVTMFCKATYENQGRWPNTEFLGKAKQYNICNKTLVLGGIPQTYSRRLWRDDASDESIPRVEAYPTTTNSVLEDICNRSLEHEEDRIAILANALRFNKRLNLTKDSPLLEVGQYSLSVALLALVLMNGEILDVVLLQKDLMTFTLQSYLDACQYEFVVPNLRYRQSFVDRCRFKSPIITPRGLETKGFLFTLLPKRISKDRAYGYNPLLLTTSDRKTLSPMGGGPMLGGKKLNKNAHTVLNLVVQKLEALWPGSKLARHMLRYLSFDQRQRQGKDIPPSTSYVLDMMSVLYQTLCEDDQKLRLARLASAPFDGEPVAIFIEPTPDGWVMESPDTKTQDGKPILANVFTSWDATRKPYNKDRVVSLSVAIEDGKGARQSWDSRTCYMENTGWVHGVWNSWKVVAEERGRERSMFEGSRNQGSTPPMAIWNHGSASIVLHLFSRSFYACAATGEGLVLTGPNKKQTSVSLASSPPSKNQHRSYNHSMPSLTEKLVLKVSLTPLTYLFTRANSLFQSQRRAWKDFAENAPDPALVNLINGPMEDTGRLLNMTQNFLRKLIDLAEIKLKQVETEAQIAGAEWLDNPTDPMNNAKFLMARKIHSDYIKHMWEAWDVGLKIIPGIQARFDDMEDTLEKLAVLIPIEELARPLEPFVVKGMEINDRMWVFAIRLLGIVRTVDIPLGVATVAVNVEKYPEADKLARARYNFGDY
ncbi:hypothetical protein J4E85_008662 [Alternaria conjuncta]|uniref:uncharacterized protein n=1 Tax=Alternaria conjuncta TaxID=181017 RepID=UPI00221EFEBC|nr:uncharacterized protein J4E85_008662 [Alternaria conjuncta]KAI4921317.1 hypothetical protein J4E85_008662 [Alternaria conjuncta]